MGQPVSALRGEVPGSQPSRTTKIASRNTPMANSGIEAQTEENTETVRSIRLRSRMPASTPSSTENGTMTAKQMAARSSVLPSRSHSDFGDGLAVDERLAEIAARGIAHEFEVAHDARGRSSPISRVEHLDLVLRRVGPEQLARHVARRELVEQKTRNENGEQRHRHVQELLGT